MRALLVLAVAACAAVPACKDAHTPAHQPAPHEPAQPAPARRTPAPPQLPANPPTLDVGPNNTLALSDLTLDEATRLLPKLPGDVVIGPRATADHHQVHATYCLPGSRADSVVAGVAAALEKAGWTNARTRGDATKAGVSAERNHYRASYVVSASTIATCAAPTHYFASLTMFRLRD